MLWSDDELMLLVYYLRNENSLDEIEFNSIIMLLNLEHKKIR